MNIFKNLLGGLFGVKNNATQGAGQGGIFGLLEPLFKLIFSFIF